MNVELRAITNSCRKRDRAVMISSTIPSAKYSCSGSPLIFSNGSTAIDGLSGRGNGIRVVAVRAGTSFVAFSAATLTTPTNRKPLRGTVRINRCSSPLSPIALRAALMRVVKFDSETKRPDQTASSRAHLHQATGAKDFNRLEPGDIMSALGQKRTSLRVRPMSALPPIADIGRAYWDVRFVPKKDIAATSALR